MEQAPPCRRHPAFGAACPAAFCGAKTPTWPDCWLFPYCLQFNPFIIQCRIKTDMLDVPPAELPSDGTVAVAAASPLALECAPPSPYSLLYLDTTDCDSHRGGDSFGSLKDEPSIEDGLSEEVAVSSAAAAPAAAGCGQGGAGWARFQIAM